PKPPFGEAGISCPHFSSYLTSPRHAGQTSGTKRKVTRKNRRRIKAGPFRSCALTARVPNPGHSTTCWRSETQGQHCSGRFGFLHDVLPVETFVSFANANAMALDATTRFCHDLQFHQRI